LPEKEGEGGMKGPSTSSQGPRVVENEFVYRLRRKKRKEGTPNADQVNLTREKKGGGGKRKEIHLSVKA